jgi:hypothetical protein
MSASSSTTLQPTNVDEMLSALKKAARSKGFDIKGDKKSGKSNAVQGATVEYVVKGQDVTVTVSTGLDLDTMERYLKEWLKGH